MPAHKQEESTTRMLAAAYLASIGRETTDIAEALGITAQRASQLKREAREAGLLVDPGPPTLGPAWTPDMMRRAQVAAGQGSLRDSLALAESRGLLLAPRVTVVPTPGVDPGNWPRQLFVFGRGCAEWLLSLITASDTVGVSWGGTLENCVSGIESLQRVAPASRPVTFVPVCGEPLGRIPDGSSASMLARKLDEMVNGGTSHSLSLSGVPFLIPTKFEGSRKKAVEDLIDCVKGYGAIFGERGERGTKGRPLVRRLSMVLTSVGVTGQPFGFGGERQVNSTGLTTAMLRKLAISDISGALLERDNLGRDDSAELARIRDHWTGIHVEQIRACAERARAGAKNTPGVVALAIGANKAAVLLECMRTKRGGLLNHLVINEEAEQELHRLLSTELG
jgi:DNA-binding transcriptional regulator LsrR (DeoR family)